MEYKERKILIIGIIVLLVGIAVSGCSENNDTNQQIPVELVDEWISETGGYRFYEGTIKNIGEKQIDVEVIVNFYDKDDNFLLSKTDYINGLLNNATADFSVSFSSLDHYLEIIDYVTYIFREST